MLKYANYIIKMCSHFLTYILFNIFTITIRKVMYADGISKLIHIQQKQVLDKKN